MLNRIIEKIFPKKWNQIIDKQITPISFGEITDCNKTILSVTENEVRSWLNKGNLTEFAGKTLHKKGLEFFFSSKILAPKKSDSLLDAAGGQSNYLKAVRNNSNIQKTYLTDQIFEGQKTLEDKTSVVGGDIANIQLPDASVSLISCHHAFEHFQENKDIQFINEAYRLLRKNGKLVIIPLFITDQYVECWNIEQKKNFDNKARVIIDSTASLPGANDDGHFARLYSLAALKKRILNYSENLGFGYEIIECQIDGKPLPDMAKNFGSKVNRPLRALKLTKE